MEGEGLGDIVMLGRQQIDKWGHANMHTAKNKKQIGCFNRMVTLVVDKLKRQWLCIIVLLIALDNY